MRGGGLPDFSVCLEGLGLDNIWIDFSKLSSPSSQSPQVLNHKTMAYPENNLTRVWSSSSRQVSHPLKVLCVSLPQSPTVTHNQLRNITNCFIVNPIYQWYQNIKKVHVCLYLVYVVDSIIWFWVSLFSLLEFDEILWTSILASQNISFALHWNQFAINFNLSLVNFTKIWKIDKF